MDSNNYNNNSNNSSNEKLYGLREYFKELGYVFHIGDDEDVEYEKGDEIYYEFLFIRNNIGYYFDKHISETHLTIIDVNSPSCGIYSTHPLYYLENINFMDLHDYVYNEQDGMEIIPVGVFIGEAFNLKRKRKIEKILMENEKNSD